MPEESQTPDSDSKLPTPPSGWLRRLLLVAVAATLVTLWLTGTGDRSARPEVDYSDFVGWVESGAVESVVMRGEAIEGELVEPQRFKDDRVERFRTRVPLSDEALVPMLREKGVRIRVASEQRPWFLSLIFTLLPWALIIGAWVWISRRAKNLSGPAGPLGSFLKTSKRRFDKSTAVDVTFDDVAGLKSAKEGLQEIIAFLKKPEQFKRLGGEVPRGVLLVGPPGTGKTLLARAVAGESGVPFFQISGSEFIEMFVGVGAARVRDLFAEAKKNAPSIVFIDEIDAVGRSRGAGLGGGHDEREQTLNQLLSEMDGFERNDEVVVLAATNRPDVLDTALLRPGRFDRRVIVDRPELAARRAILDVHTRGKPLGDDVDLDSIASTTPGFSGADLKNLVNEAALGATRRDADAIEQSDFSEAYDKIVLGDLRETRLDESERHRVAVHEAGHAICAAFTAEAEPLHRVSIIPRGMSLGATQQSPTADRHLSTRSQLEAQLQVLLGGYAAEQLVTGVISSGAESDLKSATDIAHNMIAHYGMSDALGPVYVEHGVEHPFLGRVLATEGGASDATVHAVENEIRALLASALEASTATLERNQSAVDRLVAALLEHETLEGDALQSVVSPPLSIAPEPSASA